MTGQGRRVEEVFVQGEEKPKGIWSGDLYIILQEYIPLLFSREAFML